MTLPIITRSLSVQNPWCWAIIAGPKPGFGWKPVENRSTNIVGNYRGPIALHAGSAKRAMESDYALEKIFAFDERIPEVWDDARIDDDNPLFHFGAIVGVVDIVGVIEYRPERGDKFDKLCKAAGLQWWLDKNPGADYWAEPGFCLLLDSPRQFTQPPAAKGRLSLYRLSPAEISAVAKCLRAPLGCPVEYRAKIQAAKKNAAAAIAGSK